ncbi:unnamed protein product [Discula destructiva]
MPLLHVQAGSTDRLQDIADALWKAKKVVVITGAGISTNSGIPDFRSENGLYAMIQSQFDAASKLSIAKAEVSGAASIERPRKRRKTTPPVQDSIEVALDERESENSAPPSEHVAAVADADENTATLDSSIDAAGTGIKGDTSTSLMAEMNDKSIEVMDAKEEEVVLLSEDSILANEQLLSEEHDGNRHQDTGAKEEVPDPPGEVAGKGSKTHEDEQQQTSRGTPQAASCVMPMRRSSRRSTPVLEIVSPALKLPERDQAQQPLTAQTSHPSTPKPANYQEQQTTSSSPLSSPPPADLFDSCDEQSTEPPPSSSRPSSPVSTEDDDADRTGEDDDLEPSWSQDYANRSSTFRRSLSTLKGKELFDASIWSDPLKTSVFYTFATNLRQKSRDAAPTGCHQFIGHLSKAGKMVRCYTQNIDLLEDKVGLSTRLLLGAGSRSRFSTRVAKGLAASIIASGSKDPPVNDTQQAFVPVVSRPESPSKPAVDAAAVSQGATPANSQEAPSQSLEEVNDNRQKSSHDRGVARESNEQRPECGGRSHHDDAKVEAQPVNSSAAPDKSLSGTDCATPSTTTMPEHDRGVECVFLHGSLRALRCFQCGCVADWEGERELQTMSGQQPPCPRCEDATNARQERGKRALGVGRLRPDIVLYGEDHPESQQISTIIQHDISLAPDMLIIMGTSLKVHGLKTVVREFAKTVHNRKDGKVIFVNYTKPAESVWADIIDFWVEMDCDSWVEDLRAKKPIIWMPPGSVEDEPRITFSKRRRPLTDESDKKESKKPKKVAEVTTKLATNAAAEDKTREPKPVKTANLPTAANAKPSVPKRPAAHRDCKQNAAYWTTNILGNLARMTGRVVTPGPAPYRTGPSTQNSALKTSAPATRPAVSTKVRRGPRTKNTLSRKVHEAVASSSLSEEKQTGTTLQSQGAPVAKAPSKKRTTKKSGPATKSETTSGAISTKDAFSLKQEPEAMPNSTVLAEVPVPNSGPPSPGEDIPMVAVVKNRIRKPKVFYGEESNLLPSAATRRGTPAAANARPNARGGLQAKRTKTEQSEKAPGLNEIHNGAAGMHTIEMRFLPPIIQPQHRPHAAITPWPRVEVKSLRQLEPLRPIDEQAINTPRFPFYQVARGQPTSPVSAEPPPSYLEPVVSPGPRDDSPKMSPNYWQSRAFSHSNALFRAPLDFTSRRSGGAGVPFHRHQRDTAPQQQTVLGDAPQLLVGPSITSNLPSPVADSFVPGDSPHRQLQRETDAAAVLSQMAYDQRHVART